MNQYFALLNDPDFRAKGPSERKADFDALVSDAIVPLVGLDLWNLIPGRGGDSGIGSYDEYQRLEGTRRDAAYEDLKVVLRNDFKENIDIDWLAGDMDSGDFSQRQTILEGVPIIEFRHNTSGLLFSQFKRSGKWYWRVKFPEDTEYSKMNERGVDEKIEKYNNE